MTSTLTRFAVAATLSISLVACGGKAEAKSDNLLGCGSMPVLMERYVQLHIDTGPLDQDKLLARAAKIFVGRVDGSKTLLTASEATKLESTVKTFLKDVQDGRCGLIEDIKKGQVAHQEEIEAFVKKLLAPASFAIDRTVTLDLDSEKRPRPANATERDALRTKLVNFQLANYVHGGQPLADAKAKLIKRYELITRRVKEQTDGDLYAYLLDCYAEAFDPHSSYFSADALEDFRISMQLSLEGIGAVLRQRDGYTTIAEIVKGGAADRQGELKATDRILAVAQETGESVDVIDMDLRDVVKLIRGKKGTKVRLTVLRESSKDTVIVTITRDKIDLEEQAAKLRWETVERSGKKLKLAVIDLPSFYGGNEPGDRGAAPDMAKLLEEARDGHADGVMLDLSTNTGGLLQHAVEIAGLFIREGGVVRVEGTSERSQTLEDEDPAVQWAGPLVLLTSHLSASASEIVAGAIKDYHRGVIVGDDHTFGKGSVQNVVNLPEGLGALKVTTAMFFRPSGESTQLRGVPADVLVPSPFDAEHFGEATHDNALPHRTTIRFVSPDAQGTGADAWTPVNEAVIAQLATQSAKRVKASEELTKVREQLAKAKSNDVVKVADILDGKEDGDKEDDGEMPKKDEDKLTPQAREALSVLADLIETHAVIGSTHK